MPAPKNLPPHVAIIMDGNGRWARRRGSLRLVGHKKGADVVRDITTSARELGIRYLTLFSFSVQNWKRPPDEVRHLMSLLEQYCHSEAKTLQDNDVRLQVIGELDGLPESTRAAVADLVAQTQDNEGMVLTLAVNYGGREELLRAIRHIALDVEAGHVRPQDVDEGLLNRFFFAPDLPDVDLLIRTSGECRISNFMLWQLAYSELHFCNVHWPDFTRDHFLEALEEYAARERRFGATEATPLRPVGS